MRYQTKPFQIDAVQWTGTNVDELAAFAGSNFRQIPEDARTYPTGSAEILDYIQSTWILVFDGNWIIKGSKGEFYPCDDEVFRSKYEPVPDVPQS